jgi:hypothetical protein
MVCRTVRQAAQTDLAADFAVQHSQAGRQADRQAPLILLCWEAVVDS